MSEAVAVLLLREELWGVCALSPTVREQRLGGSPQGCCDLDLGLS